MKHNRLKCVIALICVLGLVNIDAKCTETIHQQDLSDRHSVTILWFPDGRIIQIPEGESYTVHEPCTASYRMEVGWNQVPVKPKPQVLITIKKLGAIRKEPLLGAMMLAQRRRILLNYPPVSSVWHMPTGTSMLTSILREQGHEVVQRYGHILGLEYVLKSYGGQRIENALRAIRDPNSDILTLYEARMALEEVSSNIQIQTKDRFIVERNNARYVSQYYDGTVESALAAIRNREQHLWHEYFLREELPLVRDFRPDIYGISIADERQLIQGLILASMVKDESPQTLVVIGGNFWARVLSAYEHPAFPQFFDYCDTIVYREGFQPFSELAETLDPAYASGTAWRRNGEVVMNPPTNTPTDFETLPTPAFDGGAQQWCPDTVYSLYTMSNCPMSCGFCSIASGSDTFLEKPRIMSPRRVAEHMAKLGTSRFDIFDEYFTLPRQLAVGEELKKIGHRATWGSYITITKQLAEPKVCEALYKAGCRNVQLGLETLSPETLLRELKQWNPPEHYPQILANLKKAGIQTHAFVLVGLPGEPLYWGLKWIPFFERYGDDILTLKSGRYRLTCHSPEEMFGTHSQYIDVGPNEKPLHLNRDFKYLNGSRKGVEAVRDILEQACRLHWGYEVTSTLPWWVNRGRFTFEELRTMAAKLPPSPTVPKLDKAIARTRGIIRDELGKDTKISNWDDLVEFSRTLL